jgi:hypothetical protein
MLAATILPALLTMGLGGFPDDSLRPPPPPSVPVATTSAPTQVRWYGWESLLTDALSMTLVLNGNLPAAARVAGGAGLVLGVPVVHLANGDRGSAIASLAVRGGVVLLASLIAGSTQPSCATGDPVCETGRTVDTIGNAGIAVGLLLGGLVFAVVDDTVLSRVDVPISTAGSAAPRASHSGFLQLAPLLTPTRGGVSLGLGAAF